MLNKKTIILALIFCFSVLFSTVYGYGMQFKATNMDVEKFDGYAYIYLTTRSYHEEITEYNNTSDRDAGGYIAPTDFNLTGGTASYEVKAYTFHRVYDDTHWKVGEFIPSSGYTIIDPGEASGEAEKSWNGNVIEYKEPKSYNYTIYYDIYDEVILDEQDVISHYSPGKAVIYPGQEQSDFSEFKIEYGVGPGAAVYLEKWKIVDGTTRVDVIMFTDVLMQRLNEAYFSPESNYMKYDSASKTEGIVFSSVLATQYNTGKGLNYSSWEKQNIHTASRFYEMTVGEWGSESRGIEWFGEEMQDAGVSGWYNKAMVSSNGFGTYKQGGSAFNLFDNILVVPVKDEVTNVYVNYVDEDGNPIGNIGTMTQTVDGKPRDSQSSSDFHEHYILNTGEEIIVKPVLDYGEYDYSGAKVGEGSTLDTAKNAVANSQTAYTVEVKKNATDTGREIIINFVYSKGTTSLFVRHVDSEGNLLPDMAQNNQYVYDPVSGQMTTLVSGGAYKDFQESYTVPAGQTVYAIPSEDLIISNSSGTVEYQYVGVRYTATQYTGLIDYAYNRALTMLRGSVVHNEPRVGMNGFKGNNAIGLAEMVYKEVLPESRIEPVELVGKLSFINIHDNEIKGATDDAFSNNDFIDYVPAGKEVTPYIEGAYPYIVRALRYSSYTAMPKLDIITVTVVQPYTYQDWYYYCTGTLNSGKDEDGNYTSHSHTGSCGYRSQTLSGSASKNFSFVVSYQHTFFALDNFKMYQIEDMTLVDSDTGNIGGTLFEAGNKTYTIEMSNVYEDRFANSDGIIRNSVTKAELSGNDHEMGSFYTSIASPGNASSKASIEANSRLSKLSYSTVAGLCNIEFEYEYHNDYIELDGEDDMLDKNVISGVYQFTDGKAELHLDSTVSGKLGTGSAIQYTDNLQAYMTPDEKLTDYDDFSEMYLTIPESHVNGMRVLEGSINYTLLRGSDYGGKYSLGADSFTASDYTGTVNTTRDTTLYSTVGAIELQDQFRAFLNEKHASEKIDQGELEVNKINVINPLNFASFELITDTYVDHSTGSGESTVLQKGAEFTIDPEMAGYTREQFAYSDTTEFVEGYFMQFDFDIIYLNATNGAKVGSGSSSRNVSANEMIPANTSIYLPGSNSILTAKTEQTQGADAAEQITNQVRIVAVSYNITDKLMTEFYESRNIASVTYRNTSILSVQYNEDRQFQPYPLISRNDITADSYHAISTVKNTINVGRIYDFAVTDCNDLAFKDVFRKPDDGDNVNESTNTAYYSGYYKWIVDSDGYNTMANRTEDEIGTYPTTILPLGPYKHTGVKYVNAPKMGYRISFDLKTSGYIDTTSNVSRKIEITPSYYYISKDGKTFDDNISLYYKNASGEYTNFANSGYTIYFTPNDGYRYLRNSAVTDNIDTMSTKMEPLSVSSTMTLNSSMMSTNNSAFIQSWYGEYKLPNSTVAFSNNPASPNNNINNPYTDGYIGVIFDISYVDAGGITVSYNTNDKQASGTNTTQWDYEGYLGFKTPGQALTGSLKLQLEKDIWTINDYMYNQIKGTVALFDLDNRAADDFQ